MEAPLGFPLRRGGVMETDAAFLSVPGSNPSIFGADSKVDQPLRSALSATSLSLRRTPERAARLSPRRTISEV